jgi:hypothetical protein
VLYLRSACASASPANELACNDDAEAGGVGSSIAVADLPPGTYHLVVDTFSAGVMGEYTLTVDFGACTDTDGDGTCDVSDGCPADPAKPGPGQCGCGVADVDSDGDGTADCVDACPSDAGESEPQACGCGAADTDSDGDGTADCVDECPGDAGKIAPGACGCGMADVDTDGDGALDCADACASDAGKTAPGACGCGVADADGDGDGALDCADECPADVAKTEAGACGCGSAEDTCTSSAGSGCTVGDLGPASVSWHVVLLLAVMLGLRLRRRRG